jgi:hypothetical protein
MGVQYTALRPSFQCHRRCPSTQPYQEKGSTLLWCQKSSCYAQGQTTLGHEPKEGASGLMNPVKSWSIGLTGLRACHGPSKCLYGTLQREEAAMGTHWKHSRQASLAESITHHLTMSTRELSMECTSSVLAPTFAPRYEVGLANT